MERFPTKTNLFLHMGPGFHSKIEKHLFEKSFSSVEFWDQPIVNSFSELVERTIIKVKELCLLAGGQKIKLIAHSFGAQLGKAVIQKNPELISSLKILNGSFNSFECFVNLNQQLKISNLTPEELRTLDVPAKMNFIFSLATADGFQNQYWFNKDKQEKYSCLAKDFPVVDVGAFMNIFTDYLTNPVESNKIIWPGKVECFTAAEDRLVIIGKDTDPWAEVFSNIEFVNVESSGHYIFHERMDLLYQFLS